MYFVLSSKGKYCNGGNVVYCSLKSTAAEMRFSRDAYRLRRDRDVVYLPQ